MNGGVNPEIALPAAGDCRLRLINSDPTRVVRIHIEGAEAAVIAIDGIAVAPFALAAVSMGPAMRIDLVLRAPREGGVARLIDDSAGTPVQLAHFTARGSPCRTGEFDPAPLRAASIPEPDFANARRLSFTFDASDVGQFVFASLDSPLGAPIDALCLSSRIFWTINGDRGPIATMQLCRLRLRCSIAVALTYSRCRKHRHSCIRSIFTDIPSRSSAAARNTCRSMTPTPRHTSRSKRYP